jgi:anti-anti-sigma factor
MSDLARLSVETRGDVELARVAGEVDASNVAEISEELLGAVSNRARAVVLDLSQTSYIDSSGISLIFDAAARLRNSRQELRLVVPPRSFVAEVLDAVSIGDSVPIDPDLDRAMKAASGAS